MWLQVTPKIRCYIEIAKYAVTRGSYSRKDYKHNGLLYGQDRSNYQIVFSIADQASKSGLISPKQLKVVVDRSKKYAGEAA